MYRKLSLILLFVVMVGAVALVSADDCGVPPGYGTAASSMNDLREWCLKYNQRWTGSTCEYNPNWCHENAASAGSVTGSPLMDSALGMIDSLLRGIFGSPTGSAARREQLKREAEARKLRWLEEQERLRQEREERFRNQVAELQGQMKGSSGPPELAMKSVGTGRCLLGTGLGCGTLELQLKPTGTRQSQTTFRTQEARLRASNCLMQKANSLADACSKQSTQGELQSISVCAESKYLTEQAEKALQSGQIEVSLPDCEGPSPVPSVVGRPVDRPTPQQVELYTMLLRSTNKIADDIVERAPRVARLEIEKNDRSRETERRKKEVQRLQEELKAIPDTQPEVAAPSEKAATPAQPDPKATEKEKKRRALEEALAAAKLAEEAEAKVDEDLQKAKADLQESEKQLGQNWTCMQQGQADAGKAAQLLKTDCGRKAAGQ